MGFKKGLSIIELTIGIALLAMVSILIVSLYLTNFRLYSHQSTSMDINIQNKLALDEITNQIRQSQGIAPSCCSPTETTGDSVLVLQLWPLDATGEPFDPGGTNYDYIIYKLDPSDTTKLRKKTVPFATSTRPANNKIMATSLATNGLSFTYKDGSGSTVSPSAATEVTVSISTTGTSAGKTQTTTQTGNATLRNK